MYHHEYIFLIENNDTFNPNKNSSSSFLFFLICSNQFLIRKKNKIGYLVIISL